MIKINDNVALGNPLESPGHYELANAPSKGQFRVQEHVTPPPSSASLYRPNLQESASHCPQVISSGVDTLVLGVVAHWNLNSWSKLRSFLQAHRDNARMSRKPVPVGIGQHVFALNPTGQHNYAFRLSSGDLELLISDTPGPRSAPNILLRFHSAYLHSSGWFNAAYFWLNQLASMGACITECSISRVDLYADILLDTPLTCDALTTGIVAQSRSKTYYHTDYHYQKTFTGMTIGTDPAHCRIYDKIAEAKHHNTLLLWNSIWNLTADPATGHVWRVEFELHRKHLATYGISSLNDLQTHLGTCWAILTGAMPDASAWLTIRTPTENKQRCRWPIAPWWQAIQQAGARLGAVGVLPKPICGVSDAAHIQKQLYGTLTSWAAAKGFTSLRTAVECVGKMLEDRGQKHFEKDVLAKTAMRAKHQQPELPPWQHCQLKPS